MGPIRIRRSRVVRQGVTRRRAAKSRVRYNRIRRELRRLGVRWPQYSAAHIAKDGLGWIAVYKHP